MNWKRITLGGALALGLAGCPATDQPLPIDSTTAALTITQHTDALAEGVAASAAFVGQTDSIATANESCVAKVNPDGSPGPTTCTPQPVDTAQPERDAAKWLKDHLFNADHVDAALSTDTAVVFCLKSGDLCDADPKCVTTIDTVRICVKAQSFAAGEFDLALLVGATQQMNPFNLVLKAGSLKAEAKLADLKAALEAVATASGDPLPEGFPTRLEGRFQAELTKLAEDAISVKAAVLEALAIDVYPAAHPKHSEIRLAAAPELWSISLDGGKKVADAKADLKGLDLLLAADNFFSKSAAPCPLPPEPCTETPPAPVEGQMLAHLDGLSSAVHFDAATAQETLTVKDVGLGDATSKVQYRLGATTSDIVKVDLNPSLQRKLSVTYVKTADGTRLEFTPGLELLLDHDFRALAAQLPDLKGAALKAITSVKLAGAAVPALLVRKVTDASTGATRDEVRVEAGTLQVSASGMPDGFSDVSLSVAAGQCMLEDPATPPADAHPFADMLAGACTP